MDKLKKYKITLDGGLWPDSEIVVESTHYSESSNLIYFYNAKENISIDNVVAAFGARKVLYIKELV